MKFFLALALTLPSVAVAFLQSHSQRAPWGVSSVGRMDSELCAVNVIIAGAPASGKGTQCEIIKEKFGVVHLSTGDMLRAAVSAGTEVGKMAKDFMDSGKLVPDEVIIGIVSFTNPQNARCVQKLATDLTALVGYIVGQGSLG